MGKLSDTPAPVKLFLIGDSGSGKTGALTSLVCAGYRLHVVDLDNGLAPLAQLLKHESLPLDHVDFISPRDKYKKGPKGLQPVSKPTAYNEACDALDKWPEDGSTPGEWGSDHVFVLDSLTMLGRAALNLAVSFNPGAKDGRQWYGTAQNGVENYLSILWDSAFDTNVVVISHITHMEQDDGTYKGFPSIGCGTALSAHIAKYGNDLFVVETKGKGKDVKRTIRTVPDGRTDAKTSIIGLDERLPIESGLATIFERLRA